MSDLFRITRSIWSATKVSTAAAGFYKLANSAALWAARGRIGSGVAVVTLAFFVPLRAVPYMVRHDVEIPTDRHGAWIIMKTRTINSLLPTLGTAARQNIADIARKPRQRGGP